MTKTADQKMFIAEMLQDHRDDGRVHLQHLQTAGLGQAVPEAQEAVKWKAGGVRSPVDF